MQIELDFFETAAIAVAVLYLGLLLKQKSQLLNKLFIPSPAVGGLVFSIFHFGINFLFDIHLVFDFDLLEICITFFLTSIGFEFDFGAIKRSLKFIALLFLGAMILLFAGNILCILMGRLLGVDPMTSLLSGTVSLLVDPREVELWRLYFADLGVENGYEISVGFFNLGFVVSALISGLVGSLIIRRYKLRPTAKSNDISDHHQKFVPANIINLPSATYQLLIAIGIGYAIGETLYALGANIPMSVICLLVAIIINNSSKKFNRLKIKRAEIDYIGGISLSIFVALCFMATDLWSLRLLSPSMIALILLQIACVIPVVFIVIFLLTGRSYDSAILSSGFIGMLCGGISCGFSSIIVLNNTYGASLKAFLLLTLMGAFAFNTFNTTVLSILLNQI
ncbi:MAG: hypothetical protein K6F05_01540 [Succinivibrio sp.]|nr:hypothetical protein [Succinivibrio sp.]